MSYRANERSEHSLLRWAAWLLLGASLAALPTTKALATKPIRPLTVEEVAQAWVGLSAEELYLFRIELHADGTGAGGFVYAGEEPAIFRVTRWQYEKQGIDIQISPVSEEALGFDSLRGEIVGRAMELTFSGKGWKRRVSLRQESLLERRWLSLKQAMSETSP